MDKDIDDVDKRVEWLHSEHYSAAGNIFGEPQKTTRVGDEYQAQIPPLMTENERSQIIKIPVCEFGMSLTDTWVHGQHIEANAKGASCVVGCETHNDLLPVPCSSSEESWSAIEHDSFILGLYIFGKNLRVVNKFMGDKGMPNVLSYYYGKFYRSNEHQKWSMYRKKKRISKSVPGKKIFNGWRLQELLSRLCANVTDECKASLTQVVRTFKDGNLSFEKYVFTLRDTMGLDRLVQAVAIGKGKQDLAKARRRLGSKKVESTCSSLKTEEIVNVLKDRIGLSKARLNEFFWDTVWPRLLARGWHYEEARNYAFQNTKNLVFLAPGVTKFSRRNLVKGSQYFDSFNEVLNKVASEPQLLEHDPDKDRLVEPHTTQGSDDDQDLMKYTVVDTSLVGLVKKVRELTSLTVSEPVDNHASASDCGETEYNRTEESQNEDVTHNAAVNNPRPDTKMNLSRDEQPVRKPKVVFKLDPDTKMNLARDEQPVRKLKLVFKRKAQRQIVDNIKNDNTSGEDEAMEDAAACSEKNRTEIVIDLNSPRVGPRSDKDDKSYSAKPLVASETTTMSNQTHDSLPLANGQRQSRRNRALTTKALEALENGFMNPKKKKREPEDVTCRRVRAKMGHVSSCGARYLVDGVFDGSSHMVTESPK